MVKVPLLFKKAERNAICKVICIKSVLGSMSVYKYQKDIAMFSIEISNVTAAFVKFFGQNNVQEIHCLFDYYSQTGYSPAFNRVIFIDTPVTPHLVTAVEWLLKHKIEVVIRDHHGLEGEPTNKREEERLDAEQALREINDENLSVRIVSRKEHPACLTLVELGEFRNEELTLLVLDPDADGLMAGIKAVGIEYPEMEKDAQVLDGPRSEQTADNLSGLAMLLKKALVTLPPYNPKFPQNSLDAKRELFNEFAKAAAGDEEARKGLESRVTQYEAAVAEAERLAERVEVPFEGLSAVDTRGSSKHDLTTLTRSLEAVPGAKMTLVIKDSGPIAAESGSQYSLAVIKKHQEAFNLQDLIPEGHEKDPKAGLISNVPFIGHYSQKVWEDIIEPQVRELLSEK